MTNEQKTFTISRSFNAPKELVFNAFSNAEALAAWWGPKGMPITVEKLEFKSNGVFHYKMEGGGQVMWGIFVYGQIQPYDLIEFVVSFSDEEGRICRAPFSPIWPLEVFNKLTLEEKDGVTTLTLSGYPIHVTEEEEAMYYSFMSNMEQGFKATFDQLDEYLGQAQS